MTIILFNNLKMFIQLQFIYLFEHYDPFVVLNILNEYLNYLTTFVISKTFFSVKNALIYNKVIVCIKFGKKMMKRITQVGTTENPH